MSGADQNPQSKNIGPDFGLCSHLVRFSFPDSDHHPQVVVLEEIGTEGAGLAVETPYPIDHGGIRGSRDYRRVPNP